MRTIIFISLPLLLVVGLFMYFFPKQTLSNKPISTKQESVVSETNDEPNYEALNENYNIKVLGYTQTLGSDNTLDISLEINKDYLLHYMAKSITVCLVALDDTNKVIDSINNKEMGDCSYSSGGAYFPFTLTTIPVDSSNVSFRLPDDIDSKFVTKPSFYLVQFVAMDSRPPETVTEWAGMVGFAASGKINIEK